MQPLIDIVELARLLGRAEQTIRNDLVRNPAAVPPRVRLPGAKSLRWRLTDVDAWVNQHAEALKRRRGRPRKS